MWVGISSDSLEKLFNISKTYLIDPTIYKFLILHFISLVLTSYTVENARVMYMWD